MAYQPSVCSRRVGGCVAKSTHTEKTPLMPTEFGFDVLGPLRVRVGQDRIEVGQPRQRAVLVSLLMRHGASASVPELVNDVWGDSAPNSAAGSVRTYIYRLRQVVRDESGACCLRSTDGGYALHFTPGDLDVNVFRRLVAQARHAHSTGALDAASSTFSRALDLWKGTAMAGVPGPHAQHQRELLEELRLTIVEDQVRCEIDRGRCADAAARLSELTSKYPLRERLVELRMVALYGSGRQSEALEAFQSTRRLLRETLGVNPSAALERTHQLVLSNRLPSASAVEDGRPGTRRVVWRPGFPAIPRQLPQEYAGLPVVKWRWTPSRCSRHPNPPPGPPCCHGQRAGGCRKNGVGRSRGTDPDPLLPGRSILRRLGRLLCRQSTS